MRFPLAMLAALCAAIASAPVHSAQRTFVASYGNDANACTVTAPCRAFSVALGHADVGGEIIVLDSAGYGTVSVTKAVSIIAPPGIYAGITVFSGVGISVAAGSGTVVLSGLTVIGLGGFYGVEFLSGNLLRIERMSISGMTGSALSATPAGAATLVVRDSSFIGNGAGIGASTASGALTVVIEGSHFDRNTNLGGIFRDNVSGSVSGSSFSKNGNGLFLQPSAAGATTRMTIRDCVLSSNDVGFVAGGYAGTVVVAQLSDSEISDNVTSGVQAQVGSNVTLSNTTVTRNGVGLSASGGASLQSYQDNRVHSNTANGAFTGTLIKQ
jgi:hypothetical protein